MTLDRDAARRGRRAGSPSSSASPLAETAEGILTIANSNMARAIRSRTIEKGHDPREFALVAFGGAGPLHAAEVADSLGIPEVLVPPHPGITSAAGLLTSDLQVRPDAHGLPARRARSTPSALNRELDGLEAELRGGSRATACPTRTSGDPRARLPLRRPGLRAARRRSTTARSPRRRSSEFHRLHEREYGSAYGDPIEIVNARVTAIGKRPTLARAARRERHASSRRSSARARATSASTGSCRRCTTRFYDRAQLPLGEPFDGPAVVFHLDTTTVVPPGWRARADRSGNLLLDEGGRR